MERLSQCGAEAGVSIYRGIASQALRDTGGVEASRTALLSQEGSMIETAVEIVRGVVPEPHS